MSGQNEGADGAKGPDPSGVIQSPAVAQAQADAQAAALASYLLTAREWYAKRLAVGQVRGMVAGAG